jgi:hypothetical protein
VPTFGKAQSNPWCVSNHLSLTRLCWYQEHGWYSTCKKGPCISKNQIKTTRSVVRKTDRPSLSSSSGLLLVTTGQKRSRVVVVPPSQLSCKYRGYSKSESEKGRKATNGVVWSGRRWKKWPSESAATVADLSLLFSEAVWVVVAFSDERPSVSEYGPLFFLWWLRMDGRQRIAQAWTGPSKTQIFRSGLCIKII